MKRRLETALFALVVLAAAALADGRGAAVAAANNGLVTGRGAPTLCHVSVSFSSTDQTRRGSATWVVQPDCALKEVHEAPAQGAGPSGAFAPVLTPRR